MEKEAERDDHFRTAPTENQGSKNLFSNTRQGGSKRKVLVAKVAV